MSKRTKQRPLTAKQERFCQEYMIDLNATQSAIRAGYAAKSVNTARLCNVIGTQNLVNVGVKAEIERLKAETSEKIGISIHWVIDNLKKVADRCTKEDKFDAPGANRAIELIGKHVGAFEADNAQKGDKTINIINFNSIDDTKQIISGPAGPARIGSPESV